MAKEGSLQDRYLSRFKMGIVLLVVLAVPAVIHSHYAIESLLNQPSEWVPDSLPEKAEFNRFTERFSASDIVMLSWPGANLDSQSLTSVTNALRPLGAKSYDAATDADKIAELPAETQLQIATIRHFCDSPTPLRWVRDGTETLTKMTAAPARLPRATAINRLRGSLVGPDRKQTCVVFSLGEQGTLNRRMLFPQLRAMISELLELPADQIAVVGGPKDGAKIDNASISSIQLFSPPCALLAAALCFLCLRSLWLTVAITAIAMIGQGLVLALVFYTGTPMNAVLNVLPPLVFVLTVSSAIHLSNYYLDAKREFADLNSVGAAKRAMRAGLVPCLLASGTTVIGLSSLMLVRLEPIRIFGFVASVGVLTTLSLLLLMLPGAMVLTKVPDRGIARNGEVSLWRKWLRTQMRQRLTRPWPLIVCFLLLSSVFASGLFRLETSVNVPRMFQPDSDIRNQYRWFEENIGPTVTGDLLLTFPTSAAQGDPLERLNLVKRAHLCAHKMEMVQGVLSAMSFVPAIPKKRSFASTAKRSVIRSLIRDPKSSLGTLGFISRDDSAEVWRINVRLPQKESVDIATEIATIREGVRSELADSKIPVEVSFTGHIAIVYKAQEVLLLDLFRSFLTAFAIVGVVMMILLRSPIGGLLAMLPNLFPTVALFGFMGLLRVPLDIGSVMTASVALGIAVDGTIHLLSRYGSRRERGFGQIRATFGALGQCGWAMFQTTLVCGLALMVYWFSDFVPTSRFALLMFGLLTAALVGDVLLLPAMMASPLGRWLSKTVGIDSGAKLSADKPGQSPVDTRRIP